MLLREKNLIILKARMILSRGMFRYLAARIRESPSRTWSVSFDFFFFFHSHACVCFYLKLESMEYLVDYKGI